MSDSACSRCRELEAKIESLERQLRGKRQAELERSRTPRERARIRQRQARRNAVLTQRAINFRKQWTGSELELASRDDLTIAEIAARLGRTYDAVKHIKQLLVDPNDGWRWRQLRDGPEPPTATS